MKPLYASKHVQWCEREAKLSLDIFAPYFNLYRYPIMSNKNSLHVIEVQVPLYESDSMLKCKPSMNVEMIF